MAKKKRLTNREKQERADFKRRMQEQGILPPDKPKLNRKKFIEEAREESYEYTIKLEEDELVGVFISEMALIDEDGDVVAFSNFLAKGKDETEVTFTIEDNY